MEMKKSKQSILAAKFILCSALGIFMFFVSIVYNGKSSIPLDHLTTVVRGFLGDYQRYVVLLVIAGGAALPFDRSAGNASRALHAGLPDHRLYFLSLHHADPPPGGAAGGTGNRHHHRGDVPSCRLCRVGFSGNPLRCERGLHFRAPVLLRSHSLHPLHQNPRHHSADSGSVGGTCDSVHTSCGSCSNEISVNDTLVRLHSKRSCRLTDGCAPFGTILCATSAQDNSQI